MALTVGTDSYVTVAEADAYLALFYVPTDAQLVAWNALADSVKEILLRNSTRSIERLYFPGAKYATSQTLKFPRATPQPWPNRRWEQGDIFNTVYRTEYDPSQFPIYIGLNDVPDAIKNAEIEEALELSSPSSATTKHKKTSGAVESYSIGHFSEKRKLTNTSGNTPQTVLRSIKAQEYIQPFVGGGFRVV